MHRRLRLAPSRLHRLNYRPRLDGLDPWPRLNYGSRLNDSRLRWLHGWPRLDHGPLGERPHRLDYPRLDHRPLLDRLARLNDGPLLDRSHWPDLRLGLDGPGRLLSGLHLGEAASVANRLLLRPSERQ